MRRISLITFVTRRIISPHFSVEFLHIHSKQYKSPYNIHILIFFIFLLVFVMCFLGMYVLLWF